MVTTLRIDLATFKLFGKTGLYHSIINIVICEYVAIKLLRLKDTLDQEIY